MGIGEQQKRWQFLLANPLWQSINLVVFCSDGAWVERAMQSTESPLRQSLMHSLLARIEGEPVE